MSIPQIAQVLIGPGQINVASSTLIKRFEIYKGINDTVGTATFVVVGRPEDLDSLLLSRADVIINSAPALEALEPVFGSAIFGEDTFGSTDVAGDTLFIGKIARIEPVALRNVRSTPIRFEDPNLWGEVFFGDTAFGVGITDPTLAYKYTAYAITCQDETANLVKAVLETPATFTSQSDATVLSSIFSNAGVAFDMSGVTAQQNVTVQFDTENLQQCIQRIADITGAIYYVRNGVFYYHAPTANPCSGTLSDSPDNVTAFDCLRNSLKVTEDATLLANRILYKGALTTGGAQLTVTVQDSASITAYGLQMTKLVKRDIKTIEELTDLANGTLAQRKDPQVSASATFINNAMFLAGQYLACDKTSVRLTRSFLIRTQRWQWQSKVAVNFVIEFGDWRPTLNRTTQALYNSSQQSPTTPIALPPPDSVTSTMINSVDADSITGGITADQITSVHATSIDGGITASQITTVNAGSILGSLDYTQIASVSTSSFIGTIVGSQIASLTITGGNISFGAVGDDQLGTFTADHLVGGVIDGIDIHASNISSGSTGAFVYADISTFDFGTGTAVDLTVESLTVSIHLFCDPGSFNNGAYNGSFDPSTVSLITVINGLITGVI